MDSLYIVPGMPALSVALVVAFGMIFLFFARESVHKMIEVMSEATAGGFRKMSAWTKTAAEQMREKDRKVLLESGVANIQNKILEEFTKIESANVKTLADYPKLQLRLDEDITKLEADYKECGQASPEAPGWGEVIDAIARAKGSVGDRIIEKMLSEIHKSAVDSEKKALSEYQDIASKRHKILNSMSAIWKRVEKVGKEINKKIERVLETNSRIDRYMDEYAKLGKADEDSIDVLSARVTKLFIVSLVVIAAGFAGAFINFNLIALPMSELVPQGVRVGGMAVSEVSAMIVIVLEIVLGIFLMESMGVTNTFPQIGAMTSGKRKVIFYGSLLGLFFLSSVEASLAILREHLAESNMALEQTLAGVAATLSGENGSSITVIGQATLGFVLPWILAMIAIPLEMFIEASQHAFARIFTFLITMLGYIANGLAHLFEGVFKIVAHLFDIFIIMPVKIGEMVKSKNGAVTSH